jgi:hypothetical protein
MDVYLYSFFNLKAKWGFTPRRDLVLFDTRAGLEKNTGNNL